MFISGSATIAVENISNVAETVISVLESSTEILLASSSHAIAISLIEFISFLILVCRFMQIQHTNLRKRYTI